MFTSHRLFGGAAECDVPTAYVDVSQIRQVPDNQEVFADLKTDDSLIIELLEAIPQFSHLDIIKAHFEEISEQNDAKSMSISLMRQLDPDATPNIHDIECYVLSGRQMVAKRYERMERVLCLTLGVIRIPQCKTDVLITFNHPLPLIPSNEDDSASFGMQVVTRALNTLSIKDWNLFVDSQ